MISVSLELQHIDRCIIGPSTQSWIYCWAFSMVVGVSLGIWENYFYFSLNLEHDRRSISLWTFEAGNITSHFILRTFHLLRDMWGGICNHGGTLPLWRFWTALDTTESFTIINLFVDFRMMLLIWGNML